MPRKLKLSFLNLTVTCGMWVFKKDFVFISKHSFFIICQKDNLKSDEKEKIYEIIKRMNIKLVKGK